MENLYNREENLDEQIRSVKLPYFAWKVLFCVSNNSEIKEISRLLEAEEKEVIDSLRVLISNGLITEQASREETEAQEEQPEEVQEKIVEETEMEESTPETTAEEPDKTEAEAEEVAEVEEQVVSAEETQEETQPEIDESETEEEFPESHEETSELEIDDSEEKTAEKDIHSDLEMEEAGENLLDELVEESEETIDTEGSDSPEDESALETEEEKIEINIPEGEEEETTEDLEFNFNLTGDDDVEQKEEVEQKPVEPPVQEVDTSGFKKILVIDDSLVIRKMVEIALEEEELKIETAVSGKEGLEIMDQTNPDLVILDMMLPDINGIEILKTIKASKGIPVIMLSGKDSPQMIETAKNEGAEEFLPKPFKDDDLVEKIKKLLDA